ncbi:hypothetical protein BDD43_0858 [Mucilaginibacter gracilis]|uniref:Uncharacterized protein n=1 Tax=Mucilaginibacter gracilis TaxID=423350 RepID=A0A495IVE5_9SPHI|nr:hypothetical protein [Mucilaginibacter gracilis]RKR80726.1 hypothetical protein BDD43_0858 [Mucilaginibacter gracilis]
MNQIFSNALQENNLDLIKDFVKLIAMSVRNEMENFHVEHLSDGQMKELNPLIRTGIYNALFAIANHDKDEFCKIFLDFQATLIPAYWEEPQLGSEFQNSLLRLTTPQPVVFRSEFLNEQLQIGNLFLSSGNVCVKIKWSFNFANVEGDKHKHRSKISSQLRKEGYSFIPALDGYTKKR